MTVHIEDLQFKCIIGILDFERETPQDVIVNLRIDYIYEKEFLDYAAIVKKVQELITAGKFLLIEEALEAIEAELRKNHKTIQNIFVKITKPSILNNCKVSVSNYYTNKS